MNYKYCKDCNRELPITEFYYNSYRNSYEWVCKECFKKRIYKNKEARRKAFRRWYVKTRLDKNKWKEYINKKRLERINRLKKEYKYSLEVIKQYLEKMLRRQS